MPTGSGVRRCAALALSVVGSIAVAGCSSDGTSDGRADGVSVSDTAAPTVATEPDGFSTIGAVVTDADGEQCEVCLWLADTADERARGLMGVTDLGAADGMLFRFDEPTSGSFYMFQTPTPLSIAWFGSDGELVGSADMSPCVDGPAEDCARYSPGDEYEIAIEVFQGDLASLGIGPGARIELIGGSEADRCPLHAGSGDAS